MPIGQLYLVFMGLCSSFGGRPVSLSHYLGRLMGFWSLESQA